MLFPTFSGSSFINKLAFKNVEKVFVANVV